MKNLLRASLIPVSLFLSATGVMAADPNAVVVLDRGEDAGGRYYLIQCPGDNRASVVHNPNTGNLCIYPVKGEVVCIQSNDIDAAARQACGVKR